MKRSVDRGMKLIYVLAAIAFGASLVVWWFGGFLAAIPGLAASAMGAVHPWLRRTWYEIGYAEGYDAAVEAMTQT
jgi:hypothetical protein